MTNWYIIFLTKSNLPQGPEMLKADLGKGNCSKYFRTRNDSSEEASDRKEASHREQIVSSPHLGHAHSCKGGPAHWTLWTIFKNRYTKIDRNLTTQ